MSSENPRTPVHVPEILEQLHSTNTEVFDAALESLRQHIAEAKPYLLRAMTLESDSTVKGALLELMGYTKDPQFVPYVANALKSESNKVRFWAYVALQNIGTAEAQRILDEVNLCTIRRRPKKL